MKRLLLFAAFATACFGQTSRGTTPPLVTLSLASPNGDRIETRELLSTTAQPICTRSTVDVVRTSGTVLTIASLASATVPEYVRFGDGPNVITSNTTTATLSGGGASDNGQVFIYGRRAAGALTITVAHNLPAATITCAGSPGCTVLTTPTPGFPKDATPIWSWFVSAANWMAAGGTNAAPNATCWIDLLTFTNTTGGAITVTVADAQSSAVSFLTAFSVGANSTSIFSMPGGARFSSGATWVASANSSMNGYARFAKQ